jgi:hypothetical protein
MNFTFTLIDSTYMPEEKSFYVFGKAMKEEQESYYFAMVNAYTFTLTDIEHFGRNLLELGLKKEERILWADALEQFIHEQRGEICFKDAEVTYG